MKTSRTDSGIRLRRRGVRLLMTAAPWLFALPLMAGTIDFQISPVDVAASNSSPAVYSYTYSLAGFDLQFGGSFVNEIDIEFDPNDYGVLSKGHAGPDSNLLLQIGIPRGAAGDYGAEAAADHPSPAGTFSPDFTWIGPRSPADPGVAPAQTFQVNTYDNNPGGASCGDLISSTTGATMAVKRRRADTDC